MATIAADERLSHRVATHEEWLKERVELLKAEKALTRQSDEVAKRRQALPWVKVEKDYRFDSCSGEKTLAELFHGRSQLLVYHLMFGPDYKAPCPSCSSIADGFNGFWEHLANHDVMLVAISRAPFDKIKAHKERAGWTFPWVSSFASDFNYDYAVGLTDEQQDDGYTYNFRRQPPIPSGGAPIMHAQMAGVDTRTFLKELPGMSAFALDNGQVYHTYSTYARGLDAIWGMYPWLDRAPLGRNEADGPWWKRRYEYPAFA
jgi:predicted dithiol-disulfide oxidoreductase (DUF899 family)